MIFLPLLAHGEDDNPKGLSHAIDKWHHYLSIQPFVIKIDQKVLKFLLDQKLSTPGQLDCLSRFRGMQYKKGSENSVVDALSRDNHGELLQMSVSSISTELIWV